MTRLPCTQHTWQPFTKQQTSHLVYGRLYRFITFVPLREVLKCTEMLNVRFPAATQTFGRARMVNSQSLQVTQ